MATGPEHYREAEDWLTVAGNAVGKSSEHVVMAAAMVQAHAALALAAAVGTYGLTDETRTAADASAWEYAAGEYTAQRRAEKPQDENDAPADGDTFVERVDDEQYVEYHTHSDGNHTATLKRYDGADIPEDDDEDGDENHFTSAQLNGEACTVCGVDFAEREATAPSGYDFVEGHLFAHAACLESEA